MSALTAAAIGLGIVFALSWIVGIYVWVTNLAFDFAGDRDWPLVFAIPFCLFPTVVLLGSALATAIYWTAS